MSFENLREGILEASLFLNDHQEITFSTTIGHFMATWMLQVNEIVSTLTGIGALVLICLNIYGQLYKHIKNQEADKADS
jgi:hypothetical protein